jgi:hypothetical protein
VTTIAYKNGVFASDSRVTRSSDAGGTTVFKTEKLFRKAVTGADGCVGEVILATAGESSAGMVFVDWYGSGREPPELLVHGDADFTVLVLSKDGLFEYDKWCRAEKVLEPFYAIGSGSNIAIGAMEMGASAVRAVEIACRRDPYTAPPIVTMRLTRAKKLPVPHVSKANGAKRSHSQRKAPLGVHRSEARSDIVLHDNQPKGGLPGSGSFIGGSPGILSNTSPTTSLHSDVGPKRNTGS